MTTEIRTPAFCTQCRSRCGCTAVVRNERLVAIEPLPGHPSGARLCPKGKAAPELVYHPDRLTHPLRRTNPKGASDPGWQVISWDEALDETARRMAGIRDAHGAEQVAFSVTTPSGTHISDGISWVERLVRAFGSPNTIYGTEICNWHKDVATRFTYGHDIGTPDFANTDCILLWGHNPANTWLARSVEIQDALRRGARLLVVDPRRTPLARRADCWLQVRPGTDQALALGLLHLQIQAGRFDERFVREWTNGVLLVRDDNGSLLRESDTRQDGSPNVALAFDAINGTPLRYDTARGTWLDDPQGAALHYRGNPGPGFRSIACRSAFSHLAGVAAEFTPARTSAVTGVGEADLQQAAQLLGAAGSVAYYAWNGVGQSATATQTDRAISLLYALTGHYGQRGGNVPGGAARFADISGLDLLDPGQREKALGLVERPLGPGRHGWVTARDVYRAILDHQPYPVRMLMSFGTNLLASQPDTTRALDALQALEFHVHADFFLNPSAACADIVLPVATSWEREGLRTGFDASLDGLRRVQLRPAVVKPVGESRSDTDIAIALAERLGMSRMFFDGSSDAGHNQVLAPGGLDVDMLRASPQGITTPGSVRLNAHAQRDVGGVPIGFPTPSRKIEIYSEQLHEAGQQGVPGLRTEELPRAEPGYPLQLSCAKTMIYCHGQHRNLPALRRLLPEPIVELDANAAAERHIAERDWVRVRTPRGEFIARAKLSDTQAPGTVFGQHGWWTNPGFNINSAMDSTRADPVSGSIPLRSYWCDIEPLDGDPGF